MKILMLGNDKSVHGGITTVINQFMQYNWKERNIDLKFIPTYVNGKTLKKILFFLVAYLKIILYCIIYKPDIVHIHMSYKGSFSRAYSVHKLCKVLKIKDIVHLHGSEFKKWYDEGCNEHKRKKIKKLLRECYKFVVLGNEWKKNILSIEPLTKVVIINNTVKIPEEKNKFNECEFNILFLGVIIKRKGIYDLLEAISILKEKEDLQRINFFIAGNGTEELAVKKRAEELKISKYIKFLGWINSEEKKKILKDTHLLVLPSYNEGLPMAILEAMSYGIPIIATNVGDISAAVINEENGLLFNAGDIKGLVESISKIINLKEKEWETLSYNSKKIAKQQFSDEEYFRKFESIYKNLLI